MKNQLRQFQNFSFWNCFLKNRNFAGRKAEKLQEVVPKQPVLEPPQLLEELRDAVICLLGIFLLVFWAVKTARVPL